MPSCRRVTVGRSRKGPPRLFLRSEASFKDPCQLSVGMKHVMVTGTLLLRDEQLDTDVRPAEASHPLRVHRPKGTVNIAAVEKALDGCKAAVKSPAFQSGLKT